MSKDQVIIVHLRRPTSKPDEKRSDPFWEFGSFGITGCHSNNLMNPKNADKLNGVRLAFAQGGNRGTRLVYLTPPVKITKHRGRIEAFWAHPKDHKMPFRYDDAPILASNKAESEFPKLAKSVMSVRRRKQEGQFASKYRSSATCIPDGLADEMIRIYTKKRMKAQGSEIARFYWEALPWCPPLPDRNRKQTYDQRRNEACGTKRSRGCVGGKRPRACSSGR